MISNVQHLVAIGLSIYVCMFVCAKFHYVCTVGT